MHENLSKLLDRAAIEGIFGYHPKCRALSLTHLIFAHDLVIFTEASMQSLQAIKGVLDSFYHWSGLKVSFEKNEILICGVPKDQVVNLIKPLGIKGCKLPVRYLGVSLISSKLSATDCKPIVDKITKKISSWGARHLYFAERVLLIQSI